MRALQKAALLAALMAALMDETTVVLKVVRRASLKAGPMDRTRAVQMAERTASQ